MKNVFLVLFMSFTTVLLAQQKGEMKTLYSSGVIPGSLLPTEELADADIPKLFYHEVANPKEDLAFLIIPGGGYVHVAIDHEGHAVAGRLNEAGYNAYVLQYRLPSTKTMKDKRFGPLQDAQYALSAVRKANPKKRVVVIGFSAGGHLAASLSTLYRLPQTKELKGVNLRPDFSVLCYPVISMDDAITHKGSKTSLIGPEFNSEDVELFSTEKQVDKKSQPTFLMSAEDDKVVPIENSLRYKGALEKHHIPSELFTYEKGGHGFGLVNSTDSRDWFGAMLDWLAKVSK